jgi:hypothetical protein
MRSLVYYDATAASWLLEEAASLIAKRLQQPPLKLFTGQCSCF